MSGDALEKYSDGFEGLWVAMVTPMKENGELDIESIQSLARHLTDGTDVAGLTTGARIGEGPVLTQDEHVRLARAVAEVVDVPVMGSILPSSADNAIEQATAMRDAGAVAVMVFPPLLMAWGKVPESVKLSFYKDFAAGTPIPIVGFQIPIRDYWIASETFGEIAKLPQVVSMKDACFDMRFYGETLRAVKKSEGHMTMLNGNDHFVAEGAIMGAEGALIGISNIVPEVWAEIIALGRAGQVNEALELQRQVKPLQDTIFREPILEAVSRMKAILADKGVIASAHVRRPQLGVEGEELSRLLEGYRQAQAAVTK